MPLGDRRSPPERLEVLAGVTSGEMSFLPFSLDSRP